MIWEHVFSKTAVRGLWNGEYAVNWLRGNDCALPGKKPTSKAVRALQSVHVNSEAIVLQN